MTNRATGLEAFSQKLTEWSGSSGAFAAALLISILWAISGPLFRYSDTWQLVINTITNLATFLMVFIIQRSQNKDAVAINLKLNELVAAVNGASNDLISAETMSEERLRALKERYEKLLAVAEQQEGKSESLTDEVTKIALDRDTKGKTESR